MAAVVDGSPRAIGRHPEAACLLRSTATSSVSPRSSNPTASSPSTFPAEAFREGATADPIPTPGGIIPGYGGTGVTHFAYSIEAADVSRWKETLEAARVPLESEVL